MTKFMFGKVFFALFLFALSAVLPASAGNIFLSGDANIGNGIDGSSNAPITAGNSTWFSNILGTGTTVYIQDENFQYSAKDSTIAINNHYNGLSGVTSRFYYGTITDAGLAGVDLFFSILPRDSYTAGEIGALTTFLNGGGSLFLVGENDAWANVRNGHINAALAGVGSNMVLGNVSRDLGYNTTTNIDADAFNAGVSSFTYAYTTTVVSGGTSLLRTIGDWRPQTFVAYERMVPEPSSFTLSTLGLFAMCCRRRKRA